MSRTGPTLDAVALQSRDQRVLFALRLAAVPVFLGCARAAGGHPPVWVLVVGVVLAAGCAVVADGHMALVAAGFVCWFWLAYVDDVTTPWVVPAALSLLVLHTASAVSTTAPLDATFDALARARWLRWLGLGTAAALGCWLVARLALAVDAPGSATATAGTLLGLVAATWWLRRGSAPPA